MGVRASLAIAAVRPSMTVTLRSSALLGVSALVLWSCALAAGEQPAKISNFFHEYIGLNEDQISAIRN